MMEVWHGAAWYISIVSFSSPFRVRLCLPFSASLNILFIDPFILFNSAFSVSDYRFQILEQRAPPYISHHYYAPPHIA